MSVGCEGARIESECVCARVGECVFERVSVCVHVHVNVSRKLLVHAGASISRMKKQIASSSAHQPPTFYLFLLWLTGS